MKTKFLLPSVLATTTTTFGFFIGSAEARPGSWNFDGVFDDTMHNYNLDWDGKNYQLNLFSPTGDLTDAWITYFSVDASSGFVQYSNTTDFLYPYATPTTSWSNSNGLMWTLDLKNASSPPYIVQINNLDNWSNLQTWIYEDFCLCGGTPQYVSGIDNNPQIQSTPEPSQIGGLVFLCAIGLTTLLKRFYCKTRKLAS